IGPVSGSMPATAETIVIDSTANTITVNGIDTSTGVNRGTFNGTPYLVKPIDGGRVTQFLFLGDLDIPSGSTVTGTGLRGISLYAANNVNVGSTVTFNMSASGQQGGPGGGDGGQVGVIDTSGFDYGAGGTGGTGGTPGTAGP